MTDEAFREVVRETLSKLPIEFREQLNTVEVVVEPYGLDDEGKPDNNLLGLFHGVPRTEKNNFPQLPDKISIYKEPILRISQDENDAKKRIRQTVLHEVGHYFGLSDLELEKFER